MSSPASAESERTARLGELARRIGHSFASLDDLEAALRHRSWCAEQGGVASNERLEFLGDAVLQIVVTERLFAAVPPLAEGVLAQRRAALVNTRTLAAAARRIDLGSYLRLGRGEAASGGKDKASILADGAEAVIGAVFLDGGLEGAADVIIRLLEPDLAHVEGGGDAGDPKSRLQEVAAHHLDAVPHYELAEAGPDHAKEFAATVFLDDHQWGEGAGRTKKEAEQQAAARALQRLADEGKLNPS